MPEPAEENGSTAPRGFFDNLRGGLVSVLVTIVVFSVVVGGIVKTHTERTGVEKRDADIALRQTIEAAISDDSRASTERLVSFVKRGYYPELDDVYPAVFSRISDDWDWIDQGTLRILAEECPDNLIASCAKLISSLDSGKYTDLVESSPGNLVLKADRRYEGAIKEIEQAAEELERREIEVAEAIERREKEAAYERAVRNEMNACPYCTREAAEARVQAQIIYGDQAIRQTNSLMENRCSAGAEYYPVGGGIMGKCPD